MSTPMTRREFLGQLTPEWATRQNLIVGLIGAGIALALAILISLVRNIGLSGLLKAGLIGFGLLLSIWVIRRMINLTKFWFTQFPPWLQAGIVVPLRFAGIALGCYLGALVVQHWQAQTDHTEICFTAAVLLLAQFMQEWRERRAASVESKQN